jgi:hypothetical protein
MSDVREDTVSAFTASSDVYINRVGLSDRSLHVSQQPTSSEGHPCILLAFWEAGEVIIAH